MTKQSKLEYKEYLQTNHWKNIRRKKLEQCAFKCQLCGSKGELHIHHNTYQRKGCEYLSDLVVLCGKCHAKFHDIEIDEDYDEINNDKNNAKQIKFCKAKKDLFYDSELMKYITYEAFAIYCYLCLNENIVNNKCITTIKSISKAMRYTNLSRKEKLIKESLIKLKEIKYINFNKNINRTKNTNPINIEIVDPKNNFINFKKDDYLLFDILAPKQFTVYCMLKAYYNNEKGYSYPTLLQMSNSVNMSKTTVVKILNDLKSLGVININTSPYKNIDGAIQKGNNMYTENYNGIKKLIKNQTQSISKPL